MLPPSYRRYVLIRAERHDKADLIDPSLGLLANTCSQQGQMVSKSDWV